MNRMAKIFAVLILCLFSSTALAQEWVEHDHMEIDCALFWQIIAEYGDEPIARLAKQNDVFWTITFVFDKMFDLSAPICPGGSPASASTTSRSARPATASQTTQRTNTQSEYLFSFNSQKDGMRPVLGPLVIPQGIYIFTVTTPSPIFVTPTPLSEDCGMDMSLSIFILGGGDASQGAQAVVDVESDCNALIEISHVFEPWELTIQEVK